MSENENTPLPSVGDQIESVANDTSVEKPASSPREGDVLANREFWTEIEAVFNRFFDKEDTSVKYHATIVVSEARAGFDQSDPETLTEENIAEEAVILSQNLARDEVDAARFSAEQLSQASAEFSAIVDHFYNQQRDLAHKVLEQMFEGLGVNVEKHGDVLVVTGENGEQAEAVQRLLGVQDVADDEDFVPAFDID